MEQGARRRRGVVGIVGAVWLAFAPAAQAQVSVAGRGGPLLLDAGAQSMALSLDGGALRGPGVELRRQGAAWVGQVWGRAVDVGWEGGRLLGRVGDAPVSLEVLKRTPEPGLRLEGNFAGQPSSLIVAPFGIEGAVGGCDYTLSVTGGRYSGWRTCQPGTHLQPGAVSLSLPEDVLALEPGGLAALLSLVLSVEVQP